MRKHLAVGRTGRPASRAIAGPAGPVETISRIGAEDLAAGLGAQGRPGVALMVFLMKWTEPSAKQTLTPPGCQLRAAMKAAVIEVSPQSGYLEFGK